MPDSSIPASLGAIVISVNPRSGSSSRMDLIESIERELRQRGREVFVHNDIQEVIATATSLSQEDRLRAVVAAGGDGTVSLLANVLPQGIPLAIVPLGTENLLAKHLGLRRDVSFVVDLLCHGAMRTIDAGKANGKIFVVMASCGFDANVVETMHRRRTGHINRLSWFRPVLSSIRRYRYPQLNIEIVDSGDSQEQGEPKTNVQCRWAFIFNAPRYAMNLPFIPDADPADGQLNLCSFRYGGLFRGIYYLGAVVLKKHRQWCETEFHSFRKITITSDSRVPFQIDGDPGGELPLKIEVLANYLTVLVPQQDEVTSIP